MKNKYEDLTGKRFGRLVVLERKGTNKHGNSMWLCKCDCGNKKIITAGYLKKGSTQSCGCYQKEINKTINKTHGMSNTRIYRIYTSMKNRCYNEKDKKHFEHYGKRGIKMCDEWLGENGFINFMEWSLSHGYTNELTIDRIDVDGNYEPSNCRWADNKTQQNNTTNNHYLTINGVKKTITEWAEENGVNPFTAVSRINKWNWNPIKAVTTKALFNGKLIEYNGEKHSIAEWGRILKIDRKVLEYRLRTWNDIKKAFETEYVPRK